MKALFIHEGYISQYNGEYYSLHYNNDIVNRYKTLAEEITFLTREESFNKNNKKQNKIDVPGFKFIGLENYKTINGIRNYPKVCSIIEKAVMDTDYLIARLPGDLGSLAIKYANKHNKRYVIELVGCAWDALWNYSKIGKIFAPYLYFKTKRLVKNAPYVVYVSSNFLQNRYPTSGYSTNCSNVSLTQIRSSVKKQNISEFTNLTNKPKIILGTIGVVDVRYKGQRYVIEAISKLKKLNYNFEYQIVGGGDNTYLKALANKLKVNDEVKFIGSLPHKEVFEWLESVDIYIQPSETEGLPRALIEAMSKACICIGSNVGGIPELLPKSNIFESSNTEELRSVLVHAVENGMETVGITLNESKKYAKEIIEDRRTRFLKAFIENKPFM